MITKIAEKILSRNFPKQIKEFKRLHNKVKKSPTAENKNNLIKFAEGIEDDILSYVDDIEKKLMIYLSMLIPTLMFTSIALYIIGNHQEKVLLLISISVMIVFCISYYIKTGSGFLKKYLIIKKEDFKNKNKPIIKKTEKIYLNNWLKNRI